MAEKTNLLAYVHTSPRFGLAFVFVTIVFFGLTLMAAGIVAIIDLSRHSSRVESAKRNTLTVESIINAASNETANPGIIAFYVNNKFAGALFEDGAFSSPMQAPPQGPFAIAFLNPQSPQLPTRVRFSAQTIKIETSNGLLAICSPQLTANQVLWVDKSGSTYFDQSLTARARSCT